MKLSVVIPTLDEAEHIEAAIDGALGRPSRRPETGAPSASAPESNAPRSGRGTHPVTDAVTDAQLVEVVVVDGGSRDATPELAAAAGARVIRGERGRARQLAQGVRASAGDALVFLHADTRLPPGWAQAVRAALREPDVVGGAFRLRFDERSPALRFIEWGARLRLALWRMPYGDQALFVRRAALEAIGGVPQVPVMEDLDLVVAMKRRGRLALLPLFAVTSARRYRAGGPLRTMARHWLAAIAWTLGVDRGRVAQWVGR